ncbi:MAG: hypothetical protein ACOCV2_12265 [Persicimonas sp.]
MKYCRRIAYLTIALWSFSLVVGCSPYQAIGVARTAAHSASEKKEREQREEERREEREERASQSQGAESPSGTPPADESTDRREEGTPPAEGSTARSESESPRADESTARSESESPSGPSEASPSSESGGTEPEEPDLPPVTRVGSGNPDHDDLSEVDPEEVEVYEHDPGADNLPEGVVYADSKMDLVRVEDEYPTEDDPHDKVGEVRVDRPDGESKENMTAAMKEGAGKLGGNAIVVDWEQHSAEVLLLSDADPSEIERDTDELFAVANAEPIDDGFTTVAIEEERSLEDVETLTIDAQRGTCYWLTFALDEEADFNSRARRLTRFEFSHPDWEIDNRNGAPDMMDGSESKVGMNRRTRSGHLKIGCPQTTAPIEVELFAMKPGAPSERVKYDDMGEGKLHIQVRTKSKSEAQLQKDKKELEQRREKAREDAKRYKREQCQKCAPKKNACTDDFTTCDPYRICLERRGAPSPQWCLDKGL